MKTLFTLFLLSTGFGAVAQRSSSKHVTTDDRQLRIRVDIDQPGRSIHYSRSFDIEDMEASAVKALENRIIDSLDRAISDQNSVVVTERKHENQKRKQKDESVTYARNSEGNTYSYDHSTEARATPTPSLSPSEVAPSSVLVKEDKENGRLWMQYTFQKDGEELVIERTANVLGKSEREKQAIIRETERSFGIKTGNQ